MARRSKKKPIITIVIILFLVLGTLFQDQIEKFFLKLTTESYAISNIPAFDGNYFIYIDDNEPNFAKEDMEKEAFEEYSNLDILGRCGVAYAKLGEELMPTEERESIGMIKPTGWETVKYDIISEKNGYLYNRCHLIGYQLAGENANEKNLITCTEHMNKDVMVDFENEVASYIKETHNHVMYRVTPIFLENNLLASGVQMEAYSVEDNGKGIKFNVFVYNVEDGINIDYKTGKSSLIK